MIRVIEKKDFKEVVDLVFDLNNKNGMYSGYCPKSRSKIENEVKFLIEERNALVYEDNFIKGVLLYFNAPNGDYDVSGPFVRGEDLLIGKNLLKSFFENHKEVPVNFFFTKDSDYYKSLMNHFNIKFSENEYILELTRKNFYAIQSQFTIRKAKRKELSMIQDMHEEIFGVCYVTKDMLAETKRFNQIYLLELQNQPAGFALLLIHEDHAYLELFGLLKDFRGRGLSKSFLSKILEKAFEKESIKYCMLVVDKINAAANKIYRDLGFVIEKENSSYKKQ